MPDGLGVWFLILWRGLSVISVLQYRDQICQNRRKTCPLWLTKLTFPIKNMCFALQEKKLLFFLHFPQIPPCYSGISDIFFMHAWSCKLLAYKIILNSQVHPLSLHRATHMQKDWQYHALKRGREQSLEWFCSEPQLKTSTCYKREIYHCTSPHWAGCSLKAIAALRKYISEISPYQGQRESTWFANSS